MEGSSFPLVSLPPHRHPKRCGSVSSERDGPSRRHVSIVMGSGRNSSRHRRGWTNAIGGDGASTDLAFPPVEITWQIAVGATAGVTPFIVAGIEFGKSIVRQRKCGVCGGSGLVRKSDYFVRCPDCGGFLPWQSWKRFFTG